MVRLNPKIIEADSSEIVHHDYIIYADSLNVMNDFKPFKIASRIRVGKHKGIWERSRQFGDISFNTFEEAFNYIKEWLSVCNINHKERSLNND